MTIRKSVFIPYYTGAITELYCESFIDLLRWVQHKQIN